MAELSQTQSQNNTTKQLKRRPNFNEEETDVLIT